LLILLVLTLIFVLSTSLREGQWSPSALKGCVRLSSKTTSCFLFFFGIILMLIVWIFLFIFHIVLTVGSDLCVPNVNDNLDRLFAEVSLNTYGMMHPCQDNSFLTNVVGQTMCYIQTCSGPNPVTDQTIPAQNYGALAASLVDDFSLALKHVLTAAEVPHYKQCFQTIDKYDALAREAGKIIDNVLAMTHCSYINGIYADVVYSGVCNGVVNGLYFTHVSCILGCVFLMLALSIYRTFEHPEDYTEGFIVEDPKVPQALVAVEDDPNYFVGHATNNTDAKILEEEQVSKTMEEAHVSAIATRESTGANPAVTPEERDGRMEVTTSIEPIWEQHHSRSLCKMNESIQLLCT